MTGLDTSPVVRTIATAYARAPLYSAAARGAWMALADHSCRQASLLRQCYLVSETDDPRPYDGARHMFSDLQRGAIRISNANCVHPLWSVRENVAFRLCHDVLGHWAAHRHGWGADFDWDGEASAYEWHAHLLPDDEVRGALFTEVLGQAAHALATGRFEEQKVAFLW